jgi:hypothetical protein
MLLVSHAGQLSSKTLSIGKRPEYVFVKKLLTLIMSVGVATIDLSTK